MEKSTKRVTRKQAENEVNRYADKVSEAEVASTVANERKIKKLFCYVETFVAYRDDIALVFQLFRDYLSGKYKKCPWRTIAVLVGTIGYILAPLDLIPDFIPVAGWTDDALALAAALSFAKLDLEEYRKWRNHKD